MLTAAHRWDVIADELIDITTRHQITSDERQPLTLADHLDIIAAVEAAERNTP